MSALATAAIMAREGIDPVLQLTTRDRNRLALQGDVLGASALGIHSFLCLTGDKMAAGDQPDAAEVFEIDSGELMLMSNKAGDTKPLVISRMAMQGGKAGMILVCVRVKNLRAGEVIVVAEGFYGTCSLFFIGIGHHLLQCLY